MSEIDYEELYQSGVLIIESHQEFLNSLGIKVNQTLGELMQSIIKRLEKEVKRNDDITESWNAKQETINELRNANFEYARINSDLENKLKRGEQNYKDLAQALKSTVIALESRINGDTL